MAIADLQVIANILIIPMLLKVDGKHNKCPWRNSDENRRKEQNCRHRHRVGNAVRIEH
jgi:hypothetical protein